jgi:abortive infection bacteriophage resistance protein
MAGSFFMPTYKQKPLTIDEQIATLKNKGLTINDDERAKYWLSYISYFRLKHYTYTFKDLQTGDFIKSATFEQVLNLYFFDRSLRLIIFDAIETIEIALKTLISNKMCCKHGSHWYLDSLHFSDKFEHASFINKIKEDFMEQDEGSISAYKNVYTDPLLPPSWMIMEFTTFGTISKIFEHLSDREEKLSICSHFSLPDNVLITWFHCFTHIRNKCAHHSRLVYRTVTNQPILPSRKKHVFLKEVDIIDRSSLYCAICCIQYLVIKINPASGFKNSLINLIDSNPQINYSKIGFTEKWKMEDIWTLTYPGG